MITSSTDIYRALASDTLVTAIARIRIIDGLPSLTPENGVIIYISKYPQTSEFEASWYVWLIDFDNEPLDVLVSQIRRIFPSFSLEETGPIIRGVLTEVRTTRTEIAPPQPKEISIEPYLQKIEERFEELRESIDDRMLLVSSGRPGRDGTDGSPGRDGVNGRDGKDIVATETNLDDLRDVSVGDAKKGQALIYDGDTWIAKFFEQRYSAGGGLSQSELDRITGIAERGEPMGHTEKSESVMTFDDSTRTFTIEPINESFRVWVRGKRFVVKEQLNVQIPDETGLYFIFFDENGNLNYQEDYFIWDTEAPTAYVYWDAEANVCPYFAEERHGIVLDWQTHEYLHRTRGSSIANGFQIENYTINGTGTLDTDAQFSILNGTFFDEDLQIDIIHDATPDTESFQQYLQNYAMLSVVYANNNTWKFDAATNYPVKKGVDRLYYNRWSGNSWGLVEADSNKYVNYYVIATNNLRAPVISLMGQNQYANQADAKAESFSDLHLTGFPSKEFRFLYKITYRTANYTNAMNAIVASIQDLRYYSALPSALLA